MNWKTVIEDVLIAACIVWTGASLTYLLLTHLLESYL